MAKFNLKDSSEFYLQLSNQPVRFEQSSPVNNVFFDDANGQVFTVRSGGVTGVTVSGMDASASTSYIMEDKGPIISIKFSPDQKILAIQRNKDNQTATVEFMNFKDLVPTNIEYAHTCKWKNAKILGFVWPKPNEIAFVTDHGIELLQVLPEKKQLKSLKNTSFSGAWFSYCCQSKIVLLASNNGALLQPFSLNNSTIMKLQKLELDTSKPIAERDISVLRVSHTTWCALLRHGTATTAQGPAELFLTALTGPNGLHNKHILKTGLIGRFAVNVIDDLIVVHHQSSQTSLLFDILEDSKPENGMAIHIPIIQAKPLKPCFIDDVACALYSGNWAVLQPDFIIDVRLGCLWRASLVLNGLLHNIQREEISKMVAVLLRRSESKETLIKVLNQLVEDGGTYLQELSKVFDEINTVYKKWLDIEVSKHIGHSGSHAETPKTPELKLVITQKDMYGVFQLNADGKYIVQVICSYLASLSQCKVPLETATSVEVMGLLCRSGAGRARVRRLVRAGCVPDSRALSCLLLSLSHVDPHAPPTNQPATDMMHRMRAHSELLEVLLSSGDSVSAAGFLRALNPGLWASVPARKLLAAATHPPALRAIFHALQHRNQALRGDPAFAKGEQCEPYIEYYKKIMANDD